MDQLKRCLNPKVIALLVAGGVIAWVAFPGAISRIAPLLLVAACPLSMLLMMGSMRGEAAGPTTDVDPPPQPDAHERLVRLDAERERLLQELPDRDVSSVGHDADGSDAR